MVNVPSTVADLIRRWPTVRDFATDIECSLEAAFQMKRRGRIAPQRWNRVISAAEARGIAGINNGWLMSRYSQKQAA